MIGKIIFTVVAFVLFVYILLLKMIRKNDTTYLIILGIQAIGILLNLIKISFDVLNRNSVYHSIVLVLHYNTNSSIFVRNKRNKCIRNT